MDEIEDRESLLIEQFDEGAKYMGAKRTSRDIGYIFLLLLIALGITQGTASAKEQRTVKVGYYISDSFQEVDDRGNYSGFGYDYYVQIDKYTRWKYEFVQGNYMELYQKLMTGEIDIMSGMQKTPEREAYFDFSKYSVGNTHSEIYARSDSDLYYEDYAGFDGCNIAVMKGTITKELIEYTQEHNFSLTIKEYESNQAMEDALKSGEVDLIYASNLRNMATAKIVGKFDKKELYYAVAKGRDDILAELNNALWQISNINPDFYYQMSEKYMSTGKNATSDFTREELEYIKEEPTINVILTPDWFPISGIDKDTGKWKGIIVDILELMSKETGLTFKYYSQPEFDAKAAKNPDMLNNVVAVLADDNTWADENNVYMSNHIVEACVVMIAKERDVDIDKSVVALPKNYYVSWLMKK